MSGKGPANSLIQKKLLIGDHEFVIELPNTPDDVVREAEARGSAERGYWAHLWPASHALAEVMLKTSLLESGTRVLEIGCGLGLAGFAAAHRGADVVLTDYDPRAVELAARNLELNRLHARVALFDWNDPPDPTWNPSMILAADVLYFERSHEPIARLITRLDAIAFIADPYRPEADLALNQWEQHGLTCWTSHARGCRIMMLQRRQASDNYPPCSAAN